MPTSHLIDPPDSAVAEQVADLEHRASDVVTLTDAIERHLIQTINLLALCRMILLKQDTPHEGDQ